MRWVIAFLWIVLVIVWAVTAGLAKRTARGGGWRIWAGTRVVVVVLIVLVFADKRFLHTLAGHQRAIDAVPAIGILGDVLCALGIAVAIWARLSLGRNWGMPMTLKENPELVTRGPYAYVRHPIYSGILLGVLGSSLVILAWIAALIVLSGYFVYSAKKEERLMRAQFPDRYPAYMRRTKMLIPFVL